MRFKLIALVPMVGLLSGCGFWPPYNAWAKRINGQAELAMAESTRQIAVLEAQAKRDSAKMLAQAEVERAKGVAEANRIIADGLKGHSEYLQYLFITERIGQGASREVIYVPTEANIPILEAQRLREQAVQP